MQKFTNQNPDNSPAQSVYQELLTELLHGLSESGLRGYKLSRCEIELSKGLQRCPVEDLKGLLTAVRGTSPHAPSHPGQLNEPIPAAAVVRSAIVRAVTTPNHMALWPSVGQVGFEENVLPFDSPRHKLIILANKRSLVDAALISHFVAPVKDQRLVELSLSGAMPNDFLRLTLHGGHATMGFETPLEPLHHSEISDYGRALAASLRPLLLENRLPLIFPEGRSLAEIETSYQRLLTHSHYTDWLRVCPLKSYIVKALLDLSHGGDGLDPSTILIVPTKVLYSDDLWNPSRLASEELDTIVKFGKPISLAELQLSESEGALGAATYLRDAIQKLGDSYIS